MQADLLLPRSKTDTTDRVPFVTMIAALGIFFVMEAYFSMAYSK